ncbi:hypothetical protein RintRC_5988 [Richelia intracellularis]|nr:hypothetical protein RintRC_5988 [Richelia intracellularis]
MLTFPGCLETLISGSLPLWDQNMEIFGKPLIVLGKYTIFLATT